MTIRLCPVYFIIGLLLTDFQFILLSDYWAIDYRIITSGKLSDYDYRTKELNYRTIYYRKQENKKVSMPSSEN